MPSDRVFRVSIKTWEWMNNNFATELSSHTECWAGNRNTSGGFTNWFGWPNPFNLFESLIQRKAEELRESGDGQGLCQLEVDRMSCMIEDMRIAQENPGSFVPYPEMVEPEPVEFAYDNTYRRNEAGNLELVNRTPVQRDLLSEAVINETAAHMIRHSTGTATSNSNFYVVNPTV